MIVTSVYYCRAVNLPGQLSACISLKTPGNNSRQYPLTFLESASGKGCFSWKHLKSYHYGITGVSETKVIVGRWRWHSLLWMIFISISASNFHFFPSWWLSVLYAVILVQTKPRSPQGAPAFHTSDSWEVREDRLSTLDGNLQCKDGQYLTVIRKDEFCHDFDYSQWRE